MIEDLILGNRSYRRFYQDEPVSRDTLKGLVNLARLSASGANLQPLKYFLANESAKNAAIFSCLAWAGYLKDWPGPVEGERPAAYIVILGDQEISRNVPSGVRMALIPWSLRNWVRGRPRMNSVAAGVSSHSSWSICRR